MFINCSNHKSIDWSDGQLSAAHKYGEIVDYPFPNVSPELSKAEIIGIAKKVVEDIKNLNPLAVMCQGEQTLSYHIVRLLNDEGIRVLAGCTERNTREVKNSDGSITKIAIFNFVKFREY